MRPRPNSEIPAIPGHGGKGQQSGNSLVAAMGLADFLAVASLHRAQGVGRDPPLAIFDLAGNPGPDWIFAISTWVENAPQAICTFWFDPCGWPGIWRPEIRPIRAETLLPLDCLAFGLAGGRSLGPGASPNLRHPWPGDCPSLAMSTSHQPW